MSVASSGARTFMLARGAALQEMVALRSALEKIELAETLVDRILSYDPSREEAERLAEAKAEIRSVSSLIRTRLRQ